MLHSLQRVRKGKGEHVHPRLRLQAEDPLTVSQGAREQLIGLARREELNSKSVTFLQFYQISTSGLRRPDHSEQLVNNSIELVQEPPGESDMPTIMRERDSWPNGIRDVLLHLHEGLYLIFYNSSFATCVIMVRRVGHQLVQRLNRLVRLPKHIKGVEADTTEKFIRGQERLRRLSSVT